jgi:hypothetical protein
MEILPDGKGFVMTGASDKRGELVRGAGIEPATPAV